MAGNDGSNCIIANLKSQIGQLERALQEAVESRLGTKLAKEEIQEWLSKCSQKARLYEENLYRSSHSAGAKENGGEGENSHQGEDQEIMENLDTSHQGPPCAEEESTEVDDAVEGELLEGQAKSVYQTQAARANYLCLDRPDIGFATKRGHEKTLLPNHRG